MPDLNITIIGAGITGLWQALALSEAGHKVTLIDKSEEPFEDSASQWAGAMLAPYCEAQLGGPLIQKLGLEALTIWKQTYPNLKQNGSLVLTRPREKSELRRTARQTSGHQLIDQEALEKLEPALAPHYSECLFYEEEAHLETAPALDFLLAKFKDRGGELKLGEEVQVESLSADWVIDCTGMGAAHKLTDLRGVRGERALIRTEEISLNRAVHLIHPRFPLYIVPWSDNRFMIGATVVETAAETPITVRSALELLSAAYSLHPAFAEADIVSLDTGVRPAFPDNLPKIIIDNNRLYVNGLYRNGFLLAPILANYVKDYIETGRTNPEVFVEDYFER